MTIHSLQQNVEMATVLKKIITDKYQWLSARKQTQPLSSFKDKIIPSERSFYQALTSSESVFILECKKASPSKGLIRDDFNPREIASIYKDYAAAISVLTDEKYFQGSFDFLPQVSEQVTQPILCKDFIVDEYQVYLARYYQADAILLMLSVLDDQEYLQLAALAHQLNMGVLTEASTEQEVERAIKLNAKVIGINNRNLRNLSVDLNRVKQLAPAIPKDRIVISESGIYTHQQVLSLSQYCNGFLIGSALMSQPNITLAIRKVIFGENKVCGLTRTEDAIAAYQAGAIYGGLIFVAASPRYIKFDQAKKLVDGAQLNWVGVFKDSSIQHLSNLAEQLNLFAVQLHGNEDALYIDELRKELPATCQIWRALSIKDHIPNHNIPHVDRYIFDHGAGGSGKTFNWQLLTNQSLDKVMLAGGINPDNAQQAIKTGVLGLDMNSGVESSPAIKDATKIQQVFSILRKYPYSIQGNKIMTQLNPYFGEFGGQYVPQILIPVLDELEQAFLSAKSDPTFQQEFYDLLKNYAGRPTALTLCRNLTAGTKTKLYLKREDLVHGGAHKTNQVLGQALLAKRMGKTEIIAETGAGQHGVASALACALLGLKCRIYMGAKDVERQAPNVFRMRLMGATVIPVTTGSATLKDACNEALRDWSGSYEKAHYMLGTAAGPHPFPTIVREFQQMISAEAKQQIFEKEQRLPDAVIACVGGGSNAIGMFANFIDDKSVKLIGVEPGGHGIESGQHGASLKHGKLGIYFGMKSPMMQTEEGQIEESYSISAGLDFPSVGPQHAYLDSIGRAEYVSITDNEALEAFKALSIHEGIIPALESSHALAYALKLIKAEPNKEQLLIVNLSGRGDKDIFTVYDILKARGEIE